MDKSILVIAEGSVSGSKYVHSINRLVAGEGGREGEGMNGTNMAAVLFQNDMSDKEQKSSKCVQLLDLRYLY